jgi:hypothetical protein
MARQWQVTMDAARPRELGRFWAEVLGYVEEPPPPGFSSWEEALRAAGFPDEDIEDPPASALVDPDGVGPRIFLQRVPEAKSAKNRVHLDVRSLPPGTARPGDAEHRRAVEEAADRVVSLGGTRSRATDHPFMGYWVVCADPEGNEFCVT